MTKLREVDGKRLLAARAAKGWSRDTVAYEIRKRVPDGTYLTTGRSILRWETGKNQPEGAIVPILAEVLGVSVAFVYGEEESGEDDEEAALYGALDNLADALIEVLRRKKDVRA